VHTQILATSHGKPQFGETHQKIDLLADSGRINVTEDVHGSKRKTYRHPQLFQIYV
jgi:hypothetical protein